jgi:hypothetical protein
MPVALVPRQTSQQAGFIKRQENTVTSWQLLKKRKPIQTTSKTS